MWLNFPTATFYRNIDIMLGSTCGNICVIKVEKTWMTGPWSCCCKNCCRRLMGLRDWVYYYIYS